MIPLSLYIHLPWCIRKCPYCDFNSHGVKDEIPEQQYINTLIQDLDEDLVEIEDRSLISIFFGGGTPSLFSGHAITTLLQEIQKRIPFQKDIEITLEANPGTVEQQYIRAYHEAGVNRLSIGVQSFQDDKLKALGRIHGSQEAQQAIETAKQAGFNNFNIDIMHGLPNQSVEDACYDIQTAIELKPTHLSWYQLTIEPNTVFYSKPPTLPDEDTLWEIEEQGKALLAKAGYEQYEVSAYAKQGRQCQHNINYWEFGDYLGIGAGAHSKITDPKSKKIERKWKVKHPKDYLNPNKPFVANKNLISQKKPSFRIHAKCFTT